MSHRIKENSPEKPTKENITAWYESKSEEEKSEYMMAFSTSAMNIPGMDWNKFLKTAFKVERDIKKGKHKFLFEKAEKAGKAILEMKDKGEISPLWATIIMIAITIILAIVIWFMIMGL